MKAIKKLPRPVYQSCDATGYYTAEEKKNRFCIKYTYLLLGHLVTAKKQSNGKDESDDMYNEYLLN